MKNGCLAFFATALMLGWVCTPTARAQSRESETITRATWVIEEVVTKNKKGMPPALLRKAYAVAIFPNIIKGGFVVGGRFGNGVVLIRNGEQWSYPIFATLGGGSFGLQAGLQSTDLVLAFKSRQSLDSFFEGKDKLTINANGSFALGGMGRHAEAGTGVALKAQYLAFSRNRGLFAGASLAGTALSIDWRSNGFFYGRTVTPGDIILKNNISVAETDLPAVQRLLATMTRKTQMGAVVEVEPGPTIDFPSEGTEVEVPHDEPVTLDGRPVRKDARPKRTNPDDMPLDSPDLLPAPPSSASPVAPRTSTTPKASRRTRPPVDNSDLDFPPLEPPAAKNDKPKAVQAKKSADPF